MANTLPGTPYVESSDLVANYPAVSESLAERVDLVGILPFATSTARGTALPTPTDGQYTYLQDTNSTEFWNGSAWQSAGIDPGLRIVTPTSIANSGGSASASGGAVTFTGVSSVSLNGVFTSTYANYRLVFSIIGSTASGAFARLRASGTDDTTSNYGYQFISGSTTSVTGAGVTGIAYLEIASSITQNGIHVFDFFSPQLATATQLIGAWQNFTSSSPFIRQVSASHNVASAFDGLTIFPQSGTMTGNMRVYGYKNS